LRPGNHLRTARSGPIRNVPCQGQLSNSRRGSQKSPTSGGINVIYSGNLRGETCRSNSTVGEMPERTNSPRRSSRSSADKPEISRNATSDELTPLYYWPKVGRPRRPRTVRERDAHRSTASRPKIFVWILCAVACPLLCPTQLTARSGTGATRAVTDFPALRRRADPAAIRDCGPSPCEVFIPAGTYNSSPSPPGRSTSRRQWSQRGHRPPLQRRHSRRGPWSHHYQRDPRCRDPPAILFANANPSNRNLRLLT